MPRCRDAVPFVYTVSPDRATVATTTGDDSQVVARRSRRRDAMRHAADDWAYTLHLFNAKNETAFAAHRRQLFCHHLDDGFIRLPFLPILISLNMEYVFKRL